MDQKQIITVIICLLMMVIGLFIIGTFITTTIGGNTPILETTYDGSFTVTDPTVDQICDTKVSGLKSMIVSQWNGLTWTNVPVVNVSYSGTVVTVDHGVLVGG